MNKLMVLVLLPLSLCAMDTKRMLITELKRIETMAQHALTRVENNDYLMAQTPIIAIEVALDNVKYHMKGPRAIVSSTRDLAAVATVATDSVAVISKPYPSTGSGWEAN